MTAILTTRSRDAWRIARCWPFGQGSFACITGLPRPDRTRSPGMCRGAAQARDARERRMKKNRPAEPGGFGDSDDSKATRL
ncbi:hypothetical protein AB9C52_32340, partial [Burkholderia cenocepacia]|uniref:hypothetical protein n=1 Tax=Burkholderia cenocepacia TaxID=95486 RepID=UPI00350EB51D